MMRCLSSVIEDWALWEHVNQELKVFVVSVVEAERVCGPGDPRGWEVWERVWHRSVEMIGEWKALREGGAEEKNETFGLMSVRV